MRTVSLSVIISIALLITLLPACAVTPQDLPAEIPIGCAMAVSTTPAWGPNLIKAAQLAVNEINGRDGIGGKKLLLVVEDEGPTAASSLYAMHKLVEEKKTQIILGGTTSEAAMGAGSYLDRKGVLLVSPSATSSALANQSWSKWIFRICPGDSLQAGVVAKIIKDKGLKKVAMLVQDSVYGRGIEEMSREYLKGRAEVVVSIRYDPGKLSYLSELNSIKDKQPDCVLHAGYYADGAVIYAQALKSGMDSIPWIAVDGTYDMPLDKYIEAAKFMEKAVTGTVSIPDKQSVAYKNFADSYKKTYGIDPTIYCDTTYDGINLIAAALKKANVYNGGIIRDALSAVGKDYAGISGLITFDQNGERVAGNYGIWKVEMLGTQYQFVMTGQSVSFLKPNR